MESKYLSARFLENYGYSLDSKKLIAFYRECGRLPSENTTRWLGMVIPHILMAYQAARDGCRLEDLYPFLVPQPLLSFE